MKDNFVVKRATVERMRMTDQSGVGRPFGALVEQGFEASGRPIEKE